jgi:hypothetical protein
MVMGMGMGVGFSSPPPWTPAAVPGCILYGGAYQEARATFNTQPSQTDLNMELAGVANWPPYNSAITKQTAHPHTGSQHLRTTQLGGGVTHGAATRTGLIAGNRYLLGVWVYGDGSTQPKLSNGATWTDMATAAAAWQFFSKEFTDTSGTIYLGANPWVPGAYVDLDDVTLSNLSLQSYTPAYTTIPGSVLAQATPTAQPWVSSDGLGIRYQGGDRLQWSAAKSNCKCLHDGTGATVIIAARLSTLNDANWLFSTCSLGNLGVIGMGFAVLKPNQIKMSFGNNSGNPLQVMLAATPIDIDTLYVFTIRIAAGADGVTIRKNGVNVLTGTLDSPNPGDPTTSLGIGAQTAGASAGANGVIGHTFVANRVLTDAECTAVENYILAQATL